MTKREVLSLPDYRFLLHGKTWTTYVEFMLDQVAME
jgi:hypothetical protein